MVFFWGRQLQISAGLREPLIETISRQEYNHIINELNIRREKEPIDPKFPPPEGFGPPGQIWDKEKYQHYSLRIRPHSGETDEEKTKRESKLGEFLKWEADEKQRYSEALDIAKETAKKLAESKVPESIDISLLGGGWSFLLEFSTVIVIIFTLLVIGVLGILEGRDITTILASIAGYVLGRAGSATKTGEKEKIHLID